MEGVLYRYRTLMPQNTRRYRLPFYSIVPSVNCHMWSVFKVSSCPNDACLGTSAGVCCIPLHIWRWVNCTIVEHKMCNYYNNNGTKHEPNWIRSYSAYFVQLFTTQNSAVSNALHASCIDNYHLSAHTLLRYTCVPVVSRMAPLEVRAQEELYH